jgi:hypothetical protein
VCKELGGDTAPETMQKCRVGFRARFRVWFRV